MEEVEPCWVLTTSRAASSNNGSRDPGSMSLRPFPSFSGTYSGRAKALGYDCWLAIWWVIASTSGVSTKAHCTRVISLPTDISISPRPISWLAPGESRIVRESIMEATLKAIRAGKLALITPVMIFVEGRWVAMII